MRNRIVTGLLVVTLPFCQVGIGVAYAEKVKYAKTEVEKARGKCVGSIVGGALLGALVGRLVDKKGLVAGAGLGAGAGAAACAVIMANAKRADRIIAAQIAAARYQDTTYTTSFAAEDGSGPTLFEGKAGASESIGAARLRPVRYMALDGSKIESPVLAEGSDDCRPVATSITGSDGARAALPTQTFCRTPKGDYEPYEVIMADKGRDKAKVG